MAINYSYFEQDSYRIIKTHVSNIVSEVIKKPVCSTENYGINGGFFNSINYNSPPTDGLSIAHDGKIGNPSSNSGKYRGTLFTYSQNGQTKAGIIQCTDVANLKTQVGYLNFKTIIGGGSLALGVSEDKWLSNYYDAEGWNIAATVPLHGRSGIGLKTENGEQKAFLAVSVNGFRTLTSLRNLFIDLGCTAGMFLDGSGSAQMQVYANGGLIQEKGTDSGAGRYIWNMVKLINKS